MFREALHPGKSDRHTRTDGRTDKILGPTEQRLKHLLSASQLTRLVSLEEPEGSLSFLT